jgi:hypothetical protein
VERTRFKCLLLGKFQLGHCGTELNSAVLPNIEHFLNYLFGLSKLTNVTMLHCSDYRGQSFCIVAKCQLKPS